MNKEALRQRWKGNSVSCLSADDEKKSETNEKIQSDEMPTSTEQILLVNNEISVAKLEG